ncbi:MAG: two-component sensor histidine kinase [Propionibacteriales bacterium]|nr:two-component sensor histidine kinase [Propionibacteriales bacterium]
MVWPRAVALALAPLTVAFAGAAVTAQLIAETSTYDAIEIGLTTTVALVITGLAVLVALREPRNSLAVVMAWMGLLAALVGFSDTYLSAQASAPASLPPLPTEVYAFLSVTWAWLYAAITLLFLLFPTGRPLSRRWAWMMPILLLDTAAIQAIMMTAPGPMDAPYQGLPHPFGTLPLSMSVGLRVITFPLFISCMLLAAVSLWLRYRRGDHLARRQVKWLVLALLLLPLTLVLSWGGLLLAGTHAYAGYGMAAMYVAVPLATAIAVLRHDLFDVDRAVASAAAYAVLTVGVVAVYLGAAALSGALLGGQSPILAALVTAAMAVALGPARRRVQRVVDRVLYPPRRRALDALADLQRRVNGGDAAPEELEAVLRAALRSSGLRVGVLAPGASTYLDSDGTEVPGEGHKVVVAGQTIGVIAAREISRRFMHEVANRAGLLVELIRLRLESTRALEEARASRARLQEVGYEERRRLERDLHDVAQQRLVSLGISMRLAERRLTAGGELTAEEASALIRQWVGEVTRSTSELRDLAHGIRPSALDDGLQPALALMTQWVPLPLDTKVTVHSELPDAISTTAYHVVAEAIANALKHSTASRLELTVAETAGTLVVRVRDDGSGGAVLSEQGGLSSLRDRVAAAGGTLRVASRPGMGTTVEAELPVDEEKPCAS